MIASEINPFSLGASRGDMYPTCLSTTLFEGWDSVEWGVSVLERTLAPQWDHPDISISDISPHSVECSSVGGFVEQGQFTSASRFPMSGDGHLVLSLDIPGKSIVNFYLLADPARGVRTMQLVIQLFIRSSRCDVVSLFSHQSPGLTLGVSYLEMSRWVLCSCGTSEILTRAGRVRDTIRGVDVITHFLERVETLRISPWRELG